MNIKLTSLIVLGVVAMTAPAFAADSTTAAPTKTAKISSPAPKSKAKTHTTNKKRAAVVVSKKAK
jgi:hypothetical protein